jgi:hypothetical protein
LNPLHFAQNLAHEVYFSPLVFQELVQVYPVNNYVSEYGVY